MVGLWPLCVSFVLFSHADLLAGDDDLIAAAARLHNQVLEERLSLQGLAMNPLALNNVQASFTAASQVAPQDSQEELQRATLELQQTLAQQRTQHEEAALTRKLKEAAQRLESQQRSAGEQLERSGAAAAAALDHLALGRVHSRTVIAEASTGKQLSDKKEPLALQQTTSQSYMQLWRQRNPALAALLMEPALYSYSMLVWIIVMLMTGASSALCIFGNKVLALARQGQELAAHADAEAGSSAMSPEQMYRYPGSYGSFHEHLDSPAAAHAAAHKTLAQSEERQAEDLDYAPGVESWVRVPCQREQNRGFPSDGDEKDHHELVDKPRTHLASCSYGYIDDL